MINVDEDIVLSLGLNPALKVPKMELKSGLWALVGKNGSGKSTFLNALHQLQSPVSSHIHILGKRLKNYNEKSLALQLATVYPKTQLFGPHLVKDVLALGRLPHQNIWAKIQDKDQAIIDQKVQITCVEHFLNKPFNQLSDGEKQMVMITKALIQETPIILMDEPSAFLDVVNRKVLIKTLSHIVRSQNQLIVFSTHDVENIPDFCDGLLYIHQNQLHSSQDKSNFKSIITDLFEV